MDIKRYDVAIFVGERVELFLNEGVSMWGWEIGLLIDGAYGEGAGPMPVRELGLALKAWKDWVKNNPDDARLVFFEPWKADGLSDKRKSIFCKYGFVEEDGVMVYAG